jgi:GPH family glycoside/pentoside/hexuronide:cation symporter
MAGIGMMPGLFVRERFAHKTEHQSKVSIWDSLKGAAESTAFLTLVAIIVLNTLSGVLAMGIDQYVLVYFMNHGDKATGLIQKGLLTSGYGVVGFAPIPIITWLGGKFGKSGSLYFVYSLMVIGGIAKWFIFTPGHPIIHLGRMPSIPLF